jgi:hypothetical protein
VNPINDGANTGLSFQGPFGARAGTPLDLQIAFVIGSNPAVINGEALAMQGFGATGGGSVQVTESMCVGAIPASNGSCSGSGGMRSLDVFDNSGGIKAFDSVSFSPVSILAVSKDIMVQGGGAGTTSSAGVSLVINTVPGGSPRSGDTPEPVTAILLGSGLLVTSLLLRRLRGV